MESVGGVLLCMYATLGSAVVAGIVNSIWCKSKCDFLKKPIDAGKKFKGKRIFGDHKTWKGFVGYIFFNIIFAVIFGWIYDLCNINHVSYIYQNHRNFFLFNVCLGALIGLAYALFELPNSFMKRRMGIKPGKTTNDWRKWFFVFLDQADSVFGVCLVVCIFYHMSVGFYLLYVLIGAVTHIIINMLLYLVGLRKNMF